MPNIFITNYCNLKCPYCFAKGLLGYREVHEMTLDEIKEIRRKLFDGSSPGEPGKNVISILGGEPTQHSKFTEIIDYFLNEGFVVKLFTNGTFSSAVADYLYALPQEKINIILNINRKEDHEPLTWDQLTRNLTRLHQIIILGLTIADPQFDYETIFGYIKKFQLKKDLRLGVAVPIVGTPNAFIPYSVYKQVGARIVEMSERAQEEHITVGFDCGFTLCMFTRKQLGRLQLHNVALNFKCDGAIDIGKEGRIWCCFPLYNIENTSLEHFNSIGAIKRYYNKLLPRKKKGVSGRCGSCSYYKGAVCSGGCYGFEFI